MCLPSLPEICDHTPGFMAGVEFSVGNQTGVPQAVFHFLQGFLSKTIDGQQGILAGSNLIQDVSNGDHAGVDQELVDPVTQIQGAQLLPQQALAGLVFAFDLALLRLSLGNIEMLQTLDEAFNLPGGVNNPLLAGEVGVAFKAHIGANIFFSRSRRPCIAATANNRGVGIVFRMNLRFHVN
jgi:hypothetical protein